MTRRWSESQLSTTSTAALAAAPDVPGFVACSISAIPSSTAHIWHTIYQAAFAQAVVQLVADAQPTRYQRLVLQPCLN